LKKHIFCLFKISIQGVLLWHFMNWFIPSIFLLSTLVAFSWRFCQV
jgi:hypothetical protein